MKAGKESTSAATNPAAQVETPGLRRGEYTVDAVDGVDVVDGVDLNVSGPGHPVHAVHCVHQVHAVHWAGPLVCRVFPVGAGPCARPAFTVLRTSPGRHRGLPLQF